MPAALSARAVPAVAVSSKPSCASARATGTTAILSASRTVRNARPPEGSARPAARSALANAVGKSAALAITSPVERISGPSTGSAPGKRANGSTAALTWKVAGRSVALGSSRLESGAPAARRQAASTRLTPIAFDANGTVREARGFTSST